MIAIHPRDQDQYLLWPRVSMIRIDGPFMVSSAARCGHIAVYRERGAAIPDREGACSLLSFPGRCVDGRGTSKGKVCVPGLLPSFDLLPEVNRVSRTHAEEYPL